MRYFILIFWFLAGAVHAQDQSVLSRALEMGKGGDWDGALAIAQPLGFVAVDIVEWHRLRAGEGTFEGAQSFVSRRPDWPGLPYLIQRSEITIPVSASTSDVLLYFFDQAPRTGRGALRKAEALRALGQGNAAAAEARRAWENYSFLPEDRDALLAVYERSLRDSHAVRMETLLWAGHHKEAVQMFDHLSAGWAAYAQARIALQKGDDGVNALIAQVPDDLRNRGGLAHDRFQWRLRRGLRDGAIELILSQSHSAAALDQPEKWASKRIDLARREMRTGQAQRAYDLAAHHHLNPGRNYAELEWLAGYIALRKLNRADVALYHFLRHQQAVDTPISLSRSHYWQGRAYEAMNNAEAAKQAYTQGAQYQTAYYGLLSAEKAGVAMDSALTGRETFPDWQGADFTRSSVYEAGLMLIDAGETRLGVRFMTHLSESLDRTEIGQLAQMAADRGDAYLQVQLAKRAVRKGIILVGPYFPLHPVSQNTGDVSPALALAIARRESEFYKGAESGVGALGLMQLMPATAREVARGLDITYSRNRLTEDPAYNARLGIAYLSELQDEFGHSPAQIAAGYNAGPGRPAQWMRHYGDPRQGQVDVVDWVEHIPFDETRNYVMRVTESLPIYRARLSGQVAPINFLAELKGNYIAPILMAPATSLRPVRRPF